MTCIFRPAFRDEVFRARSLFASSPADPAAPLRWFLATKKKPVERIVGAIWHRFLSDGIHVEFDWTANGAFPAGQLADFRESWREELQKSPGPSLKLRFRGWHAPHSEGAEKARMFGLEEEFEEKRLFSGLLDEVIERVVSAAGPLRRRDGGLVEIRPLNLVDLPQVSRWAEEARWFDEHDLLEGLRSAAGTGPTLFHLHASAGVFDGAELVGACLIRLDGSAARVMAWGSSPGHQWPLLHLALESLRDCGHVFFECPLDDAPREMLHLASAGSLRRYTTLFPNA